MGRTAVLQDIRMMRFEEIYGRYRQRRLSCAEASDLLGVTERTFLRWRVRYEEEGLEGLCDGRLGRVSPRRAPAAEAERIERLYRERYQGWTVKHFHERAVERHDLDYGYTWTKSVLYSRGAVTPARKRSAHRKARPRKPMRGMLVHQDGSRHAWLAGRPPLDLIVTLDDATSEILSAFLVEEEGTLSTFRGLAEVIGRHGLFCALYTDRGSHYFHTPKAGEKVDPHRLTQVGRALRQLGIRHIPAYSPEARGRSGAAVRHVAGPAGEGAGGCGDHRDRGRQPLSGGGLHPAPQRPLRGRPGRARERLHALCRHRHRGGPVLDRRIAWSAATTRYGSMAACSSCRPIRRATIGCAQRFRSAAMPTAEWPCSMDPGQSPDTTPTASS